jgi:hypothetical protein
VFNLFHVSCSSATTRIVGSTANVMGRQFFIPTAFPARWNHTECNHSLELKKKSTQDNLQINFYWFIGAGCASGSASTPTKLEWQNCHNWVETKRIRSNCQPEIYVALLGHPLLSDSTPILLANSSKCVCVRAYMGRGRGTFH